MDILPKFYLRNVRAILGRCEEREEMFELFLGTGVWEIRQLIK